MTECGRNDDDCWCGGRTVETTTAHLPFVRSCLRPCAAVCAISTLNEKNIFFSDFALAAAKAKRRYPLPDPFQDSDVGKSGENSDVAKIDAKNKIVHENRPSRPVLLPLPSSAKSTSGSPADTAPLFKTRLMRLRRAKCDCVSVSPVIVARS